MALSYTYPAVYVEEQPVTGPIEGVGTSTPALIGATLSGPVCQPTRITNWTQFKQTFGDFSALPRLYLPHAVRGFFDNGGTVAYVVRVGTATRAAWDLADRGNPAGVAVHAEALDDGTDSNGVTLSVQDAVPGLVANADVLQASAAVQAGPAGTVVTLSNASDAAKFRVGDVVVMSSGAVRYTIARITGDQIMLASVLAAAVAAGDQVRLADLTVGQTRFRVTSTAGMEPGTVLKLAQNNGNTEDAVILRLEADAIVLAAGLTRTYLLDDASPSTVLTSYEFTLVVAKPGLQPETFPRLSMDPRHSRYAPRIVSSASIRLQPAPVPGVQVPPKNLPAIVANMAPTANGVNDDPTTVGPNHYQLALDALRTIADVNMVCVPGRVDIPVQEMTLAHCEAMGDRIAILDGDPTDPDPIQVGSALLTQRAALDSANGFAALYYPWIAITDPQGSNGDPLLLVPPSGHLAGIYARSDVQRGVHKAPANENIAGAIDLGAMMSNVDQGVLNVQGINVLRIFPGQRPIVWGARTTAPVDATPWRYVNVRRLFLFVEKSIQSGINWAVFEPNNSALWKKLERTITEFLMRVWRSGALVGDTAAQAFFVKVDEELNPDSIRALGQVVVEIGIAPVRPAEFVVVRIAMWDSGSDPTQP